MNQPFLIHQQTLKKTIDKTLTSHKPKHFSKNLFQHSKFPHTFPKSIQQHHQNILKQFINHPHYQQIIIHILNHPQI
ncbi:GerD family protein, partial [Bacillus altitudinis]|uniref:GerD family protein n=1 Tax=Bacillus altitudinis TaxID=293387 RepID=UPI003B521014